MTAPSGRRRGNALVRVLLFAGVIGLLFVVLSNVFGTSIRRVKTADPSVHSVSAIGHSVLFEILGRVGFEVRDRRFDREPIPRDAILVIAEPEFLSSELEYGDDGDWFVGPNDDDDGGSPWDEDSYLYDEPEVDPSSPEAMRDLAESATVTWIVLPKRDGVPDFSWISDQVPVSRDRTREILDLWCPNPRVVRRSGERWTDHRSLGDLRFDLRIDQLQLIAPNTLGVRPIVECESGTLVGELTEVSTDSRIFVLSDPDLVANHGISDGDHAAFVVDLLESSIPLIDSSSGSPVEDRPVEIIFDEVFHGLASRPSIYESFSQPPLVFILIHVLFLLAALFLCGTRRFGRAVDEDVVERENDPLIESTVHLLSRNRRDGAAVEAVVSHRVRAVGRERLGDRVSRNLEEIARQIDELDRSKTRSTDLVERSRRLGSGVPSAVDVVEFARDLSKWETEVNRGTR